MFNIKDYSDDLTKPIDIKDLNKDDNDNIKDLSEDDNDDDDNKNDNKLFSGNTHLLEYYR